MGLVPNEHIIERITMGITNSGEGGHGGAGSELDSHANMIVTGEQAYVFSKGCLNANVRAFSEEASGI